MVPQSPLISLQGHGSNVLSNGMRTVVSGAATSGSKGVKGLMRSRNRTVEIGKVSLGLLCMLQHGNTSRSIIAHAIVKLFW